jgi:hypothetical protein
MNDPNMVAFVYMDAGNLTDKPVIGQGLRPERIHLELRNGLRFHTSRNLRALRHRRAPFRRNAPWREVHRPGRRCCHGLLGLNGAQPGDG